MIPFKRILCPIDFSESSRLALDHAVALARWYRAELRALHVYTAPAGIGPWFPQLAGRLSVGNQETLRRRLASLLGSARASGVRVRNSVRVGDPATEILRHTALASTDLIVMGIQGRGGLGRKVFGSVAKAVSRDAPCPVLLVPERSIAGWEEAATFSVILCPLDSSPASLRALEAGLVLAQEACGRLVLLRLGDPGQLQPGPVSEQKSAALVPDGARVWADIAERTVLDAGAIPQIVNEEKADLLVLGTSGRDELGPTGVAATPSLLRAAACPVLVVPASSRERQKRTRQIRAPRDKHGVDGGARAVCRARLTSTSLVRLDM